MTHTFAPITFPSPDLVAACADRERLYTQLDAQPLFSTARDTLARQIWAETAVMAHHRAHDQGLADIAAAIPRASERLAEWDTFFVCIARMAQTAVEPPVACETLLRCGLLPISCGVTIADFHHQAVHLLASLDQGNAASTRHAMQSVLASCTFTPNTSADATALKP